jgi:hypothetical protein
MTTLSTVVFIPYWIAHTLRRRNLPYTAVMNFADMAKVFSPQDLALLLAMNRDENLRILNLTQEAAQSNEGNAIGLEPSSVIGWNGYEWFDALAQSDDQALQSVHNTVQTLAFSEQTRQVLQERLYSEEGAEAHFDTSHAFIDLGRQHIGVVIHPGYFIEATTSSIDRELLFLRQYELTREILLALYVQAPGFHLVASSPVFLRYLGLLSKKRMMLA